VRTTLTIDEDLFEELQKRARESNRSFKAEVNDVLRRGLRAGEPIAEEAEPFVVEARACGFRPGIDPAKLNQLLDDLEVDEFASVASETLRIADS
jgi:plasmid stability protein